MTSPLDPADVEAFAFLHGAVAIGPSSPSSSLKNGSKSAREASPVVGQGGTGGVEQGGRGGLDRGETGKERRVGQG